jgi:hypothetical protein
MRLTAFVPASAKTPWSGGLLSRGRRNADRNSHGALYGLSCFRRSTSGSLADIGGDAPGLVAGERYVYAPARLLRVGFE